MAWRSIVPPEPPINPERRTDSALLCFCIGVGLLALAWFLGLGGVIAAGLSGGDPAALAGGLAAIVLLPLTAIVGFILVAIGAVWIGVRVLADRRDDKYSREVER